jgi:catechol-2,3-dioxygenase
VLGVTDHHIIESIYFFDPNGIRVELTTPTVPQAEMQAHAQRAHAELDAWTLRKAQLRARAAA